MSPWAILLIALVAIVMGSLRRAARDRQRPALEAPDQTAGDRPRRNPSPPLARRRIPPPLPPLARPVERALLVAQPVRQVEALRQVAASELPPIAKVENAPLSATAIQVLALLKHRQTLRAAIMLREVMDPPLCRRRRLR
jgi:hypothetical protein